MSEDLNEKKQHYEKEGIISMAANLLEEPPLGANISGKS